MQKIIKYNILIHLYVLLSIIGVLFLFFDQNFAWSFLAVGASSELIAFGIAIDFTIGTFVGGFAGIWCVGFPLALIITYILSFKKSKTPFCIVVIMDTLVVWGKTLYMLFTADYYSFKLFLPDLIISSLFAILMIICIKQKKFFLFMAICIIVIMCSLYIYLNPPFPNVKSFSVDDYTDIIQEFPSDVEFGYIKDAQTARKCAEDLWIDIYGIDVKSEKPYQIYFDDENDIWLVTGTIHGYVDGGYAYAIIQMEDGKVLAVWHEK